MENDYSEIRRQLGKYHNVQGLMRYVNVDSLKRKHKEMKGKKAAGVDKVSKEEYEKELETNLEKLIKDMKKFSYKPKASRRVNIPKSNGKTRPLGIPSYEDKLVQGVFADILTEIYEPIFLNCSNGFRPNRDCHKAIKDLDTIIMRNKTNYIVEADIKGFFDNVNHEWLIKFLEHEIKDQNFVRYIKRFLIAGVMENGKYYDTEKGTPQGGLISPILANVYLHYVLDLWYELYIKVKCKGKCELVRYADDFVACFENEEEAKWYLEELKERLAKFDLEIEMSKSRIFPFGRNNKEKSSFDFLGFTIHDGKTINGYYKVDYTTNEKRSKIKKQKLKEYIKTNMHIKPANLIKGINRKLIGLYNYYGISFNMKWLQEIYNYVIVTLKKYLCRRSQKDKTTWEKVNKILLYNPIVKPKITFNLW